MLLLLLQCNPVEQFQHLPTFKASTRLAGSTVSTTSPSFHIKFICKFIHCPGVKIRDQQFFSVGQGRGKEFLSAQPLIWPPSPSVKTAREPLERQLRSAPVPERSRLCLLLCTCSAPGTRLGGFIPCARPEGGEQFQRLPCFLCGGGGVDSAVHVQRASRLPLWRGGVAFALPRGGGAHLDEEGRCPSCDRLGARPPSPRFLPGSEWGGGPLWRAAGGPQGVASLCQGICAATPAPAKGGRRSYPATAGSGRRCSFCHPAPSRPPPFF